MRANYISFFRERIGLGQSKSACQTEGMVETSNTVVNVKQASCPKKRQEKSKALLTKESELFSQYRLDL